MRFRMREALRPLDELRLLLSMGALVEESLSTRLDSVRAPDLLWVSRERLDPERLDPDARLREPAFERLFDEEERPPDFDEEPLEPPERLLLLDEALSRLEQADADAARLVKLRFFAGVTNAEAAKLLGYSESTAKRTWAYARAFLHREMTAEREG